MAHSRLSMLLALAIGVPAIATAATPYFHDSQSPCFSTGTSTYRLTTTGEADYTIKITDSAAQPDIAVQIVGDPSTADFVLVDGAISTAACGDGGAIRTIRLDRHASDPDLTIAIGSSPEAYKIYAQSKEFSAQDAAALFAMMWKSGRNHALAAR